MEGKKFALVTGAARGIGFSIAKELEVAGFEVATPNRKTLDLLSNDSIDSFAKRNNDLGQGFDAIVNNAGINVWGGNADTNDEDFKNTMQVNLFAPIRLTNGLLRGMKERKWGRIVNISSIWSVIAKTQRLAYITSKTAVAGWTRSLAVELAPDNILVNTISPGFADTTMTWKHNTPETMKVLLAKVPMGRLAKPEEIGKMVVFLASENNTFMTGQNIIVDGGYTIQ